METHGGDESDRGVKGGCFRDFIGCSPEFLEVTRRICRIATTDVAVLVRGETGTGKELCVRAIHSLSPRAGGPLVTVNCGQLPTELIANELFGHECGAFTGATHSTNGFIERAHGGTLVLDELDSLELPAQGVLLRVLQDKHCQRLGGRESRPADVRFVAIANTDLEARVRAGLLRKDLYYRLKVAEIVMPPLRQRLSDIDSLSEYFVEKYARQFRKPVQGLTADCLARLKQHTWPGNVRELEAVLQAAVVVRVHEIRFFRFESACLRIH